MEVTEWRNCIAKDSVIFGKTLANVIKVDLNKCNIWLHMEKLKALMLGCICKTMSGSTYFNCRNWHSAVLRPG
jgi:hypothetical protein